MYVIVQFESCYFDVIFGIGDSMFLQNDGIYLQVRMLSQRRRKAFLP
jgi:hypothetical protein